MRHFATPDFWDCLESLPQAVQRLARRNYRLLKETPAHRSLHFKKIGRYRSVRVGLHHRALGIEDGADVIWFWIGSHADYDRLIG
ncbi:hypothetical protein [Candidatus Spongiihabitans sp.]|uniref:ParE family toxin-like protein n=1 Tax=Candidatus Spongiihabitans sp. TaxID=3101308 RepID=UPI003C7AA6EC